MTDFTDDIAAVQAIDAIPTILEVVCETTGMGFAAVARVTEDRWIACQVRDGIAFGLAAGGELDVETTLCREVRQAQRAIVIDDVAEDPDYCGHRTPALYGFKSYISVPIVLRDGRFFGTLCAIDPRPHLLSELKTRNLFKLFAELIAFHLHASQSLQASAEAHQGLEQRVAARTAELAHSQDALRQSQKMEAVGQLTGGIAHDFNNLLTGITGSLELLQMRAAQGRFNEIDRYVDAAQGAAKRAAALTHRLLAFARRQTLEAKATDVNRLVQGMEDMVRRSVGPEHEVEVVTAAGLWTTMIDRNQLENALLNLCINARDAMPEGGRMTIETANLRLDAREAEARELQSGDYIAVSVTDTGTGMSAEVVQRAFDPFYTTKPIGEGTGLGLSMVYGFARQSNGHVGIHSEVGHGTSVRLVLPRFLGPTDVARDEHPSVIEALVERDETILIVDDEPTVRMLIAEVLSEMGYASLEAQDGTAGLRIVESGAQLDLLITDVGLPGGMNGRQLADAARALRPSLKVLFVTGYAENAVLGSGTLAPGMHVLTKPFSVDTLAQRIRDLVAAPVA